jgi:hypothetical protein
MTDPLLLPVSAGELFDKISILRIKRERVEDAGKLAHVRHELAQLEAVAQGVRSACNDAPVLQQLEADLLTINQRLWDLENRVRELEAAADFGEGFVAAARQIYSGNDVRAALKRRINELLGSSIVEVKEHAGATHGGQRG